MSQMPQQAALSQCPNCAEPLESDDRFCGVCGYDLSAVPAAPQDHPTLTMNGSGPPGQDVPWSGVPAPGGSGTPPAVHLPTDLPGTDSGGSPLPPESPAPAASPASSDSPVSPASGVRFDRPPQPDDYPLQAPDPRVAADVASAAEEAKVCVACRAGRVDSDGYCENCGHAQPRERDHMEQESGPVAAVSDRGLRHHRNEDAFAIGHTTLPDGSPAALAVVCDG